MGIHVSNSSFLFFSFFFQFTVCTQLLVSRPDEENISSYLQLIDKCLIHEAFTETQKKRLLSWKQQVQKLFRSFPRKTLLDISGYRQQRNRGFGQSNSLPTAGSVGGGMGRRNPRQYQIPSRNVPSARLGLLGTSGFVSSTQRNTTANPTIMKQGRQNLWFANPGGSNSMPSRTHSSVQRTRSLPVHTSPQNMLMFQQPGRALHLISPSLHPLTQRGGQDAKIDAPVNPAGKCLASTVTTHSFELIEAFPFLNCLASMNSSSLAGSQHMEPQSQLQSDGDIFDTSHISRLIKPERSLEGIWGSWEGFQVQCACVCLCVLWVCGGDVQKVKQRKRKL
ncbi:protein Smaug homolog 1 [Leptonychotes weddellii]|uniref:Protein Smaug homolog 1 n=1 Tax=Leptonychotes weddellii TaxID=9713 RepID=A0A7F8R1F8_LEPWE|nr:protein Smaug homolog 1 [Leptonychotes weddellii]